MHLAVEREAVHDALLAGDAVDLLHIAAQSGVVAVLPVSAPPGAVPWQSPRDVETVGERIEHDRAAEHRVVLEDDEDVLRRFQGLAGLGRERQTLHPVGRVAAFVRSAPERRRAPPKRRGRLCIPLRIHEPRDRLILHRDATHLHEARQLIGRRVGLCVRVLVTEQMDTHEVERIAQLTACGVGGVVTEQELAPVIQYSAACRRASSERVAPLSGVQVLIRQIRRDRSRHVVHPAERADRTGLLGRVLLGTAARDVLHRETGPLCHVPPVRIEREHPVRIDEGSVRVLVDGLTVRRRRRPVHQTRRLERGRVAELHADERRRLPRDRLVLVRRDRPRQRQQDAQTRRLRSVFPGRVDAVADAQTVEPEQDAVRLPGRDIVQIERDDIAPCHVTGSTLLCLERSGYKSADVFQLVLF